MRTVEVSLAHSVAGRCYLQRMEGGARQGRWERVEGSPLPQDTASLVDQIIKQGIKGSKITPQRRQGVGWLGLQELTLMSLTCGMAPSMGTTWH